MSEIKKIKRDAVFIEWCAIYPSFGLAVASLWFSFQNASNLLFFMLFSALCIMACRHHKKVALAAIFSETYKDMGLDEEVAVSTYYQECNTQTIGMRAEAIIDDYVNKENDTIHAKLSELKDILINKYNIREFKAQEFLNDYTENKDNIFIDKDVSASEMAEKLYGHFMIKYLENNPEVFRHDEAKPVLSRFWAKFFNSYQPSLRRKVVTILCMGFLALSAIAICWCEFLYPDNMSFYGDIGWYFASWIFYICLVIGCCYVIEKTKSSNKWAAKETMGRLINGRFLTFISGLFLPIIFVISLYIFIGYQASMHFGNTHIISYKIEHLAEAHIGKTQDEKISHIKLATPYRRFTSLSLNTPDKARLRMGQSYQIDISMKSSILGDLITSYKITELKQP